jgi:PPOX class F420-dependent enzyme/OxyR family protein
MSVFTDDELDYLLGERRLARIATVGKDGTPHVAPVGWTHNAELDTIDVGGLNLERTKKFRDVARSRRAAIVIDDVASVDPWQFAASRSAAAPRPSTSRSRRSASIPSGSSPGVSRAARSASGARTVA